jgi:hypothetical protein
VSSNQEFCAFSSFHFRGTFHTVESSSREKGVSRSIDITVISSMNRPVDAVTDLCPNGMKEATIGLPSTRRGNRPVRNPKRKSRELQARTRNTRAGTSITDENHHPCCRRLRRDKLDASRWIDTFGL